ncbi:MAG TPA: hypothetical protein VG960_10420 [Caulobacteraceae bacterium]|nr:hypothetical protein [Caulobacteraceae bacterium]
MSDDQIHYEVFARRNEAASMALELATEDRGRAMEFAEELLSQTRAVAVRVTKEIRDPDTGEYNSITILAKGTAEKRKTKGLTEEAGPLCVAPQDLYTLHARQRIARLLEGWLTRNKATSFELLHRPDLAEKLEAGGTDLQHAVQKIAIPEAQARNASVHEVIRTFNALIERTINRLIKDGRRGALADFSKESFAQACVRLIDDPEGAYKIGGGVAQYLADARTWSAKIDRLLDLADKAPAEERPRALAFQVLEQPLGEIMGSPLGMSELLGPGLDLGGSLCAMTRLAAGSTVNLLASMDPNVANTIPPLEGAAARLSRWMEGAYFEGVRVAVGRKVLGEVKGSRRLRPSDAQAEIDVLRALAMTLTAAAGKLLPKEDILDAFIERSRMLVGSEFVTAAVAKSANASEEVRALIRVAENVTGPANKRQAAQWLIGAVTALRFEKDMRQSSEPTGHRLLALADLQRTVGRIEIPESDRLLIIHRLGEVGGLIESDINLVECLMRSGAPSMQKLAVLLKLALGEAAPMGPAANKAKAAVLKLAKEPETRAELARSPQVLDRIRPLMTAA